MISPASTEPLDVVIIFRLMIANLRLHVAELIGTRVPAPLAAKLAGLISWRLNRIVFRLEALVARIRAGRVWPRRGWTLSAPRKPAEVPPRPSPLRGLPHAFGWLIPLVPMVGVYRGKLAHWLAIPEVAELLKAPGMARLLRPLCRMLGVAEPAVFRHRRMVDAPAASEQDEAPPAATPRAADCDVAPGGSATGGSAPVGSATGGSATGGSAAPATQLLSVGIQKSA